jgi:hypothetical protein
MFGFPSFLVSLMYWQEFEFSTTYPPRFLNFAYYNFELVCVSLRKLDKPKSLAYFLISQQPSPRLWTVEPGQLRCAPVTSPSTFLDLTLLLCCLSVIVSRSANRLPNHSSRTTFILCVSVFLFARVTHIFIGHTIFIRLQFSMYYRHKKKLQRLWCSS